MKAVTTGTWRTMGRIGKLFGSKSAGNASIKEVPVPVPAADQLLVEVRSVAINPTDFKHIDLLSPNNAIIGCDYYGIVKSVGAEIDGWAIGDRVAGLVHGGLYPDQGSFAEFLAFKVPDSVSDREAPTFGVSAVTAMQALNHELGVPWPDEEPAADKPAILIYAGSSSAGFFAIQLAVLGGYQAVVTCSPHNFELVKKYGATAAFDYRSATAIEDIKKAFPDIKVALDGYSEGQSSDFCCKCMGKDGGKIINLLRGKSTVKGVEVKSILAYTLNGKPFKWFGMIKFPAVPEDRKALERFYALLPSIAAKTSNYTGEKLVAPPTELIPGGLEAVFAGMDLLRQGKVSGKKLIVSLVSGGDGEQTTAESDK